MKLFALALCLLPFCADAQFSLETKGEVDQSTQDFLEDVANTLPRSVRDGIDRKITIDFRELDVDGRRIWGMVKSVPLLRKKTDKIYLNVKLLENIKTGENYKFAKGTLLHELSHIFDLSNKLLPFEKELNLTNKNYSISDSPVFLNLTGWKRKTFTKKLDQSNKKQIRRVDVYEDTNPQETFAVNFEHFLLDREFKCRKPELYRYLSKTLDHDPHSGTDCKSEYRLEPGVGVDGSLLLPKSLDPARLYEVHYLFAAKGKSMMSRWGHAMIRLVMCAPSRTKVDEKCLQDRAHHLVLSFRADITNYTIDNIKGLTGKYPSKMFVLPMGDVIQEYTVGELRDLKSIPLRMTKEQKTSFISMVLDRYWNYEGKYYFITNNCAHETLALLKTAFPEEIKMLNMKVTTPLGITKELEKANISDMSVFQDQAKAVKYGYLFESAGPKLEKNFMSLRDAHVLVEDVEDVETFLNTSTFEARKEMIDRIEDPELLGKVLYIEKAITDRKILEGSKKVSRMLDDLDRAGKTHVLIETFEKIKALHAERFGMDLTVGYGIPQESDRIFRKLPESSAPSIEISRLLKEYSEHSRNAFKNDTEEIEKSLTLRHLLLRKMDQFKKQRSN